MRVLWCFAACMVHVVETGDDEGNSNLGGVECFVVEYESE